MDSGIADLIVQAPMAGAVLLAVWVMLRAHKQDMHDLAEAHKSDMQNMADRFEGALRDLSERMASGQTRIHERIDAALETAAARRARERH